MSAIPKRRYTLEEYFELDKSSEERYEFFDGEVVAMTGARLSHNRIASNLIAGIRSRLGEQSCEVLPADMRIKAPKAPPYRYADVVVVCGPLITEDIGGLEALVNPHLIVEILSPNTEAYDRGAKFLAYQSIESFQEYLLIAQDRPYVTHYERQPDGHWLRADIEGLESEVILSSFDCVISLRDIYANVEFSSSS